MTKIRFKFCNKYSLTARSMHHSLMTVDLLCHARLMTTCSYILFIFKPNTACIQCLVKFTIFILLYLFQSFPPFSLYSYFMIVDLLIPYLQYRCIWFFFAIDEEPLVFFYLSTVSTTFNGTSVDEAIFGFY